MSTIKKWNERENAHFSPVAAMQAELNELRAALAASGGNAAPPDACPVAITDSSAPNGIKWYVKPPEWLADGMNLYFVPAKIVPASAPNAALVAALQNLLSSYLGIDHGGYRILEEEDEVIEARAALSATGQEVKP